MSLLKSYLSGWRFRTTHPTFDPGEELPVFVTGVEDTVPIARVGDTVIRLPNGSPDLVDRKVLVRIERFDTDTHVGEATITDVIGGDTVTE